MSLVRKPDGRYCVRVWRDGRQVWRTLSTRRRPSARVVVEAKAARALAAVLLLAGCIPVPSFVGRPAAVPARDEGDDVSPTGVGIALGSVFGTVSTPGEQTDQGVVAGDMCLFGDLALGHRSDLRVIFSPAFLAAGGSADLWGDLGVVFRHQVAGSPYQPFPQESERKLPVDISVQLGLGATWVPAPGWHGNVHVGVNVSFGTGRCVPYLSYRYHWGTYDYEEEDTGAFEYLMLFLGLEVDETYGESTDRTKITPEVFFGRSPPWGPQGDKAWNTFGFNFVVAEF